MLSVMVCQTVILLMSSLCINGSEVVVNYSIGEEQPALTNVGNVAEDSLSYANVSTDQQQRMKFQILTQGNPSASYFQIDETISSLRTAAILDREKICPFLIDCVLKFNVAVYINVKDTDNLDLFKIIEIRVTLNDINDNAPEFPNKQVSLIIPEDSNVNSESFVNGAKDRDTGVNNSIQGYQLQQTSTIFALKVVNNSDGFTDLSIVVQSLLDREVQSSYQLVVYAVDGGKPVLTGSVIIDITIADVNDNAPLFSQPEYSVSVKENNPVNAIILVVMATDADALENGLVSYHFSSRISSKILDVFDINNNGTIIAKVELDYEDVTKWTFKVEAFDHGSPAKTTTVTVIVNIADVNDNYPQINVNLPPGGTKISEAADIGSFIAHVAVYDLDVVSGVVVCNVHGDDFRLEDFKIENNYKVVLNKNLDYETRTSYEVTIECKDSGVPPLTNVSSFMVQVEDVNDNFPVFSHPIYQVTIQEELFQSTIVQVTAIDLDSGDNGKVTYGLQQNIDRWFNLNSKTGLITANTKFDREVDPSFVLIILAWDMGQVPLTSTAAVIVNITDINDNVPKFPSNPLNIYFLENNQYQTTNLNVTDPDLGINGQFTLIFPQNDLDEYFEFNSLTGEINTHKAIDREQIPYFKFAVTAIDKGIPAMMSSAEVVINIVDVNDNIPVIIYPNNLNNTKTVSVAAPVGFLIATLLATDKDEGPNGQVLYFIDSEDSKGLFKVDVNTGSVTVAREMARKDADMYKLQIVVRDNGQIQRTSYAVMNIIVEPANESSWESMQENSQNVMLVAVIVTITVVLSVAIIISILIIKFIDRRNRQSALPKVQEKIFYDVPHVDKSISGSSNISKDLDAELFKKRAKKEVSFSIDEDCSDGGNNSTLTNVTTISTLIKPLFLSMDSKSSQTNHSTTWLSSKTSSSSDSSKTDMYSEKDLSNLTQSQLQSVNKHITVGGHSDRHWLHPVRKEELKHITQRKAADDNHSETSHESTTSDSGRGGSEEDINSNRGHPLSEEDINSNRGHPLSEEDIHSNGSHPLSDAEDSKQYLQYDRQSNLLHTDKAMPRRPPPPIPTESYPRNISFIDDSVTANMTVISCKQTFSLSSSSICNTTITNAKLASSLSTPSMYKLTLNQNEMSMISSQNGHDTFLDTPMTTPGMSYSVQDIETMTCSEMTGTCRDDASTTTSGSYTINPDELCNEIDKLFFKDVIV